MAPSVNSRDFSSENDAIAIMETPFRVIVVFAVAIFVLMSTLFACSCCSKKKEKEKSGVLSVVPLHKDEEILPPQDPGQEIGASTLNAPIGSSGRIALSSIEDPTYTELLKYPPPPPSPPQRCAITRTSTFETKSVKTPAFEAAKPIPPTPKFTPAPTVYADAKTAMPAISRKDPQPTFTPGKSVLPKKSMGMVSYTRSDYKTIGPIDTYDFVASKVARPAANVSQLATRALATSNVFDEESRQADAASQLETRALAKSNVFDKGRPPLKKAKSNKSEKSKRRRWVMESSDSGTMQM